MKKLHHGFSLIELITVMVIISIIGVVVSTGFSGDSQRLQATRDDIVAGLFYAQQAAVARDDAQNNLNIRFISTTNNIDIQQDDNGSVTSLGVGNYPLTLSNGMSLTPATIDYDKLGRTTRRTLTLSDSNGANVIINVEATGYAY